MKDLTIGRLAKRSQVNIETVRYYEWRGLIPPSPWRESGYRKFSEDAVGHIRFIKQAQEVGFTVKEISRLLSRRVDPKTTCFDIKSLTEEKSP